MPIVKDSAPAKANSEAAVKAAQPAQRKNVSDEVRGQVRMHCWIAAMGSPVVSQHFYAQDAKMEEILEMVEDIANRGVAYSFGE